jgi:hypothetical protein
MLLTLEQVRDRVAGRLPARFEPLQLTFYGRSARASGTDVVIGDDYGTELHRVAPDGGIYSIDPEGTLPTRFVNSGVEQLARFIDVCQAHADRPKDESDRLLWPELEAIDPRAFADAENWWALVREQVRVGLL